MTTGIVIAGGKSTRFGKNKAKVTINNKSLTEIVAEKLYTVVDELLIVTSKEQYNSISSLNLPYKIIIDHIPGKAAIGGVYTGILEAKNHLSVVVACDMPLISTNLIKYMISSIDEYDAVAIKIGDYIEPLHAVYSKNCIDEIKKMIDRDNLSLHAVFNRINTKFITGKELEKYDPEYLCIFNINTQDDMKKIKDLLIKNPC